jgi:hypothetical protein
MIKPSPPVEVDGRRRPRAPQTGRWDVSARADPWRYHRSMPSARRFPPPWTINEPEGRVKPVTNEWKELTDEKLAKIAQDGLQGQGAPVEAMRRLRGAIEKLSASSDSYARRMLWWTIAVAALTLVQAIAAFPVIRAWFN